MAVGPGKYDLECTQLREQTNATAAFAVVIGGDKGDGFSAQFAVEPANSESLKRTTRLITRIPNLLREIADQIEADLKGGKL